MNKNNKKVFNSILYIIIFIGVATFIGVLFNYIGFPETNIVIIYILAVLLIARFTDGYFFGVLASIIATFSFNYFFTAPYFTLIVDDLSYIITFFIMTITAITTSALTTRVKQNARIAEKREEEARALYELTKKLTGANEIAEIIEIIIKVISNTFNCTTKYILIENWSNESKVENEFFDCPIYINNKIIGIIRISKEKTETMNESQKNLFSTMIESTALAIEKVKQSQERIIANENMVQERYRGNLLRSISHDIRTPLTGIMGISEVLMDMTQKDDVRYNLSLGIYKDAEWLYTLVENILNLTRIQEGRLLVNKEMEAIEEIIESAISHVSRLSEQYNIEVVIPDELILVPMDGKLIEQVIVNLLNNAIKHTQPNSVIKIVVDKKIDFVKFSIIDSGEGIEDSELKDIFEMFYTSKTKGLDSRQGIGLGLTICKAIVKAHGGIIYAENREEHKGAVICFTLPLVEAKDE